MQDVGVFKGQILHKHDDKEKKKDSKVHARIDSRTGFFYASCFSVTEDDKNVSEMTQRCSAFVLFSD